MGFVLILFIFFDAKQFEGMVTTGPYFPEC